MHINNLLSMSSNGRDEFLGAAPPGCEMALQLIAAGNLLVGKPEAASLSSPFEASFHSIHTLKLPETRGASNERKSGRARGEKPT